jgi:sugar lactone lactonase YvrE
MQADDLCKVDRFWRRTPRRAAAAGLLALACALHGCGEGRSGASARAASDAPLLVPLDSVVLAEGDSAYVAGTSGLAVAPDGSFFVSDHMAKRVHVFRRDGRFLRSIGRPGRGPGEFGGPSDLAFDGDSLLYVVDSWGEIEVFDPRTTVHHGAYRVPRQPTPSPSRPGGCSPDTRTRSTADPSQGS